MTDIYGYDTSSSYINGVNTNNVSSLDNTCDIELDNNTISLNAENVLISGQSLTDNLSQLEQKTLYIQLPVSNSGTVFSNYVYANKFIVPSGTNKQYLMADGTLLEESSNQQSNIYLYSFNQTLTPPPNSGQVRWNTTSSATTTEIYINHITSDNIDIDVWLALINETSVVYLQDKNDSGNWVRFDVNGPIITGSGYVTIPVTFQSGLGLGLTRFTAGHAIILSIFTNNLEIDLRLSLLEEKTQHQSATPTATLIESDLNINTNTQFNINDASGMLNWLHLDNNGMTISRELNMDGKKIINSTGFVRTGGLATEFLKADGSVDNSTYLKTTGGTVSGNITANSFIKTGGVDTEFLKADGSSDNNTYLTTTTAGTTYLAKAGGTMAGALNMGGQNIINSTGFYGNTFVKTGGLATEFLMANGSSNSATYLPTAGGTMTGAIDMGNQSISNVDIVTAIQFRTPTGASTDFLKADGSIDQNFYMPADSGYGATCVAYVNGSGLLTSDVSNRWCQAGVDSLQTIINTVVSNTNVHIQLSAGTHGVTALIVDKINYSIAGSKSTPTQASTIINGAVQIGQAGSNTSLIKFSDIVFNSTLTFFSNPASQQTRHTFDNIVFQSTITFPTAVNGVTGYLYFTDCVFNQVGGITFNNITCSIIFTRCVFSNQVITNNAPVNSIVFDSCRGLNSLAVTNALYRGLNILSGSSAGVVSAASLSLTGASTSFVMGNGSLNTTLYTSVATLTGNFVFNGVNCPFQARRISDGTNGGIVSIFVGGFLATVATAGSTFISTAALPVGWRPINAIFNSGRIRRLNVISQGTVIFFSSGEMGLTDIVQTNNFWAAGNTNSGLATDASFSWPVL